MEGHASASSATGAIRVLVLGMDRASESALLQRLASLCDSHRACSPVDDFDGCSLLVAHGDSAMLRVAQRTAETRSELVFLTTDASGTLRDGRGAGTPLDDDALRALLDIGAREEPPAPVTYLAPATQPLAEQLRTRIAAGSGHAALTRDGAPLLLLDFDRKLALPVDIADSAAAAQLAAAFSDLRLVPLDAGVFNARLANAHALPIAPLFWNIAQLATGTLSLLPPLSSRSVLAVRQWPDFRALAHRHDHFRLCCLLLKRASTPEEAARMLELDRGIVDGFYNAAYLSGYADLVDPVVTPAAIAPALANAGKPGGSALARMWRSVRQGLQGTGS